MPQVAWLLAMLGKNMLSVLPIAGSSLAAASLSGLAVTNLIAGAWRRGRGFVRYRDGLMADALNQGAPNLRYGPAACVGKVN